MARKVDIVVTANQHGFGYTFGYPAKKGTFMVPLYDMTVVGNDENSICQTFNFRVMRFGVQWKHATSDNPSPQPKVVGLSQQRTYKLKTMITKSGSVCWQIKDDHLIHSGSRHPMLRRDIGAVIGCVAVTGEKYDKDTYKFVSEWDRFNTVIFQLSGTTDRDEITREGSISVRIDAAIHPPLKEAR